MHTHAQIIISPNIFVINLLWSWKCTKYEESLIIITVRVAYYEPAYYEHLFIMNQAESPNGYILIAFVLNKVRLI